MGIWNGKISDIRARLRDWLIYSTSSGNVANLDLDLLNRANEYLQAYRSWDSLVKTVTLTLDGTGRSAVLPTDLKSILEVYVDNLVIGKPNFWFYENDSDVAFRYTKEYTYDKATGGYWTITFPSVSPLLNSPKLKYNVLLPSFTGVDENGVEIDEYSFFPPELLLRCAQKIHAEEKGLSGDFVGLILQSFNEQIKIFETMAQANNQRPDLTPKNKFGMPTKISGHTLDGLNSYTGHSPWTPAQAAGFHGY